MTKSLIQCSVPLAAILLVAQATADPALQQVAWPAVDALRVPAALTAPVPAPTPVVALTAPAEADEVPLAKHMELPSGEMLMILPPRTLTYVSPEEDPRR